MSLEEIRFQHEEISTRQMQEFIASKVEQLVWVLSIGFGIVIALLLNLLAAMRDILEAFGSH